MANEDWGGISPEIAAALTPADKLTLQFYDWEDVGRGWFVVPHPIELEPPFRPFVGYVLPALSPGFDDGRRPTLLSRVADGVKGLFGATPASSPPVPPPAVMFPPRVMPELFVHDEPLVELQVAVPPDQTITPKAAEALILALSHAAYPVAFEVVGDGQGVAVQFCSRTTDAADLRQSLAAVFPTATLREEGQFLASRWYANAANAELAVDFALAREFMLPLRDFRAFDVDPLAAIISALASLGQGETGVFQVLFEAARNPWAGSMLRVASDGEGGCFFADAPEFLKRTREKAARPLVAAVIRAGVVAGTPERALQVVRSLAGALAQFDDPAGNALLPLDNERYPDGDHVDDLLNRQTRRFGMLLNAAEVASLVHLPSSSVHIPRLLRDVARTKVAPGVVAGQALRVGENVHRGVVTPVTLSAEQRGQHAYVIGASGTGKSTLLCNMIVQDMAQGQGLAVLDPHGDLVDQLLDLVPEERVNDVVVFDPADAEFPVGFNVLAAHSELEKTLLASDLVAVFRRLSTSWGDQMNAVLANAVLAFLESRTGGTLAELRRFLVERAFRDQFLATVGDPEVVYYWRKVFPTLQKAPQASILTRLDAFLRPRLVRNVVAQKKDALDVASLMREGKILLAKLSQGAIGEENSYLLGTLLVSKFHQVAMSRQEFQHADRRPFFLYVDEFHNFVTPTMAKLLASARKYRLGLVLTHQELRQLASRDPETADAVLTNPHTRVCFRVGEQDAKKLAEGFSDFDAHDLTTLGRGEAVCRVERSDWDFNLRTDPPPQVDAETADARRKAVVEQSRALYATPRAEVEAAQQESFGTAVFLPPQTEPPTPKTPPHAPAPPVAPASPSPQAASVPPSPPPVEVVPTEQVPTPPSTPGRGGEEHKTLQRNIRERALARGWRAEIEHEIPKTKSRVDVALALGDVTVACEVCVTSPPAEEVKNLKKCLAAGFAHVVSVATERRGLRLVEKAAASALADEERARVRFLSVEELFSFLAELEARQAGTTATIRGRRVTVSYTPVSEEDAEERRERLATIAAKSTRRGKGEKSGDSGPSGKGS